MHKDDKNTNCLKINTEVASSQALPALKVALDDECSGKSILSRAAVVNSNMSRGKYLAREGPGSKLIQKRHASNKRKMIERPTT